MGFCNKILRRIGRKIAGSGAFFYGHKLGIRGTLFLGKYKEGDISAIVGFSFGFIDLHFCGGFSKM